MKPNGSISLRGLTVTLFSMASMACAPIQEITEVSGEKQSQKFVGSIQGASVTVSLRDDFQAISF